MKGLKTPSILNEDAFKMQLDLGEKLKVVELLNVLGIATPKAITKSRYLYYNGAEVTVGNNPTQYNTSQLPTITYESLIQSENGLTIVLVKGGITITSYLAWYSNLVDLIDTLTSIDMQSLYELCRGDLYYQDELITLGSDANYSVVQTAEVARNRAIALYQTPCITVDAKHVSVMIGDVMHELQRKEKKKQISYFHDEYDDYYDDYYGGYGGYYSGYHQRVVDKVTTIELTPKKELL
jgi:hypothetical protein